MCYFVVVDGNVGLGLKRVESPSHNVYHSCPETSTSYRKLYLQNLRDMFVVLVNLCKFIPLNMH